MTVRDMTIRVAQWATGNVGRHSLAMILDRPDLELVSVYVTSPSKVGRDAGDLAGRQPCGIVAVGTIEELLATEPDVVIHTPLPSLVHGDDPDRDLSDITRLLAAGVDVITTVGYMHPAAHGPVVFDRLDSAARSGGATFHGTGANPGWFGDVLPLVMSGLSLRVDAVRVQEISNFQYYPSPEIMFDIMGFGATPEELRARGERHQGWLDGLFTEAVHLVAEGLGARVDRVERDLETLVAPQDLHAAAGVIRAGTVAAQRWRWQAFVGSTPFVEQETVWRIHRDMAPQWPVGDWSLRIEGEPRMELSLPHGWNRDLLASTAAHAVNAIGVVNAADPGIATFLELPMVLGRRSAMLS
jgi:hypothetical protein